ncbi:MAG: twin-arginine translocase TatA/TatE family subunit [Vicingaceae bacterium]
MTLLFFSTQELIFVALAIVLLFGSKKIPEIARGLGKGIREFKNATSDIQEEIRKTSKEVTDRADPSNKSSSSAKDSDNK